MPSHATPNATLPSDYPHPIAFSIQLSRNAIVQGLGMGMVALTGVTVLPGPLVIGWTLLAAAIVGAENYVLRRMAKDASFTHRAAALAPILRVMSTTTYALAAFALIMKGGPGERLFAFALISASMVHVLMRYYRSPRILAASLAPWVLILGSIGFDLGRTALAEGRLLAAVTSTFTIGMLAVQFWSARAQLSGAWLELMAARQAAEARERAADAANRAKSQFLANMSHELRTPLNGVLGMAQALTSDRLTRVQQERVAIIRRSSESLLSVLNDLLDLSRIEASALGLETAEFDLEDLVQGVAATYQPMAANKQLGFHVAVADDARGRYEGDVARIRRILQSLADNAVKFTASGGVKLTVERSPDHVIFRMADTGIGICADDLTHLFEDFFQADASLTRRYGGAGIGLAVCRELTSLMGGVIEAESTLGEGSTFTVKLPLRHVQAPADQRAAVEPEATADAPASEQPAGLRVLAAEDNATNQLVLKTLLAPAGIAPTVVDNGRKAVEAWEQESWDVILMDIQMPEMNGIEATLTIRRRETETGRPRTPIVAVTANAMTHQVSEYEAAGMDGVVAKPIDMGDLFAKMERALAQPEEAAEEPGERQAAS